MKTSVFVGTSLDGFIARANGAFDFLKGEGGEGGPHGYDEFMATVDALVIGRNTFDIVRDFDPWPYGQKIVSLLAARGFQHLYVDGGITIQRFLRAGMIQRIIVNRVPVLIGSGIPLFGPLDRDVRLEHVRTQQYAGGLVQSEYVVAG